MLLFGWFYILTRARIAGHLIQLLAYFYSKSSKWITESVTIRLTQFNCFTFRTISLRRGDRWWMRKLLMRRGKGRSLMCVCFQVLFWLQWNYNNVHHSGEQWDLDGGEWRQSPQPLDTEKMETETPSMRMLTIKCTFTCADPAKTWRLEALGKKYARVSKWTLIKSP